MALVQNVFPRSSRRCQAQTIAVQHIGDRFGDGRETRINDKKPGVGLMA
jgi:hypothetical protein